MNSAEQNPATNQMLETPPNAAANNADAADPSISAFRRKHSTNAGYFLPLSLFWSLPGQSSGTIFPVSNPLTMLRWTPIYILSALASLDMFRKSTLKTMGG